MIIHDSFNLKNKTKRTMKENKPAPKRRKVRKAPENEEVESSEIPVTPSIAIDPGSHIFQAPRKVPAPRTQEMQGSFITDFDFVDDEASEKSPRTSEKKDAKRTLDELFGSSGDENVSPIAPAKRNLRPKRK